LGSPHSLPSKVVGTKPVPGLIGKTLRYAAQNQLEYFAELSAMYFVGCNYPPANRSELKAYDPAGYDMIERYWDVGQALPPASAPPTR